MMNELEKHMQHEAIKNILKQAIDNNPYLDPFQKERQKARIDAAAAQADRFENMLSLIKYLMTYILTAIENAVNAKIYCIDSEEYCIMLLAEEY